MGLREALNLFISTRVVHNIITSSPHLKYVKIKKAPYINMEHMAARLTWACSNISRGSYFWKFVVFSDGKKINLNVLDCLASYLHDLGKGLKRFPTRQNGWVCDDMRVVELLPAVLNHVYYLQPERLLLY